MVDRCWCQHGVVAALEAFAQNRVSGRRTTGFVFFSEEVGGPIFRSHFQWKEELVALLIVLVVLLICTLLFPIFLVTFTRSMIVQLSV